MKPLIPFLISNINNQRETWLKTLQEALPNIKICSLDDMTEDEKKKCEVAIVANPEKHEILQLPNLKWVQSLWAGVEMLVNTFENTNVKIVRLIDPNLSDTMAEAVLAWTLYLHRDMPLYHQQQKKHIWEAKEYHPAHTKNVGILGLGELGRSAAQKLLAANFKLCGWSQNHKSISGVKSYAGKDELIPMLKTCDIVVNLLPLTDSTKHILNTAAFNALPNDAQLINFGRGGTIDDDALLHALNEKKIKHAVLDVFSTEPLPNEEWQWDHPNLTVLPHCAAPTNKTSAAQIVAHNIKEWLNNKIIPVSVDLKKGY